MRRSFQNQKNKPRCPKRFSTKYWKSRSIRSYMLEGGVGKWPKFTCVKCGYFWLSGEDGGEYLGNELGFRAEYNE